MWKTRGEPIDLPGFSAFTFFYPSLDVGLPVAGLEVEVEGEALGALELGQPDFAARVGLVAPHHLPAVALGGHPKVLRIRPASRRGGREKASE